MITFIAIFLAMLAAAAVILLGCLAGYVRHQLREALRMDRSRQLSRCAGVVGPTVIIE
jgi:hypothetical protein